MKPGKHQSRKQRGQDGGWKVHGRAHLLFFTHTLCMNYVIAMFLLVSRMNTRNHFLYFARFCARTTPPPPPSQNSEQNPTKKNFALFHNHLPLLTMVKVLGNLKINNVELRKITPTGDSKTKRNKDGWKLKGIGNDDFEKFSHFSEVHERAAPLSNLLAFYYECCSLIGYATHYPFFFFVETQLCSAVFCSPIENSRARVAL